MQDKIYQIKINGIVEVNDLINPELEYSAALFRLQNDQGKVSKRVDKDDRDVLCWTMTNLGEVILKAGDKVIKGKAKGASRSQALRMNIKNKWEAKHVGSIDEEVYYSKWMERFFNLVEEEDIY